jgi:hypothetical protein
VKNWLNLFVDYHNKELVIVKWTEPYFQLICIYVMEDLSNFFLIYIFIICSL